MIGLSFNEVRGDLNPTLFYWVCGVDWLVLKHFVSFLCSSRRFIDGHFAIIIDSELTNLLTLP